jgi:hypothetical protein
VAFQKGFHAAGAEQKPLNPWVFSLDGIHVGRTGYFYNKYLKLVGRFLRSAAGSIRDEDSFS